ncbi:hypothetical protein CHARACLAT_007546 [Characodon lateralis]|uniref:Uncharacterized protein n=1 Tax=Characodon lateralis TaxID=208331 RepID=A0ABU7DF49_9TELE|nr:hypothetical protein [Characodon lateralis]
MDRGRPPAESKTEKRLIDSISSPAEVHPVANQNGFFTLNGSAVLVCVRDCFMCQYRIKRGQSEECKVHLDQEHGGPGLADKSLEDMSTSLVFQGIFIHSTKLVSAVRITIT